MKMKRVLIFPAGTEIGIEIFRALNNQKNIEVIGGASENDHSQVLFETLISNIPSVYSDDFLESIKVIVREKEIDYIFPAHDSVVLELAKTKDEFSANVIGSDFDVVWLLRSKKRTYNEIRGIVSCPEVFSLEEARLAQEFPYFMKPSVGQGSKGATKITTNEDLEFFYNKIEDPLILEYLPGKEFTIDCFTAKNGELIFCEGRERARVMNGISTRTVFAERKEFKKIAEIISQRFHFNGPWFFQLKEASDGSLKLLEISPRISGTSGFFRLLGVNLPLLSIQNYEYANLEISFLKISSIMDRSLAPRFLAEIKFENLYVDLDDTLVFKNKVNSTLVKFIFECRNNKKKTFLITKHEQNVAETLKKYRLTEIFDSIIHLKKTERKVDFMIKSSLLVDDSFRERSEALAHGFIAVSYDALENLVIKDV